MYQKKPLVTLPKYVFCARSRGKEYFYYQKGRSTKNPGKRYPIPGTPHEPDFWAAVAKLNGEAEKGPEAGSFNALVSDYRASPDYAEKSAKTRKDYDVYLNLITSAWGELKVRNLRPRHVLELRDSFAKTPSKANYIIRVLSLLISWGVPRDYADVNPCRDIRKLRTGTGYAPWPWEDIEHFREHAKPEMWWAAALALYTGQRQSDVLKMRWSDIENGMISVRQQKTGKELWLPIHADLQKELELIERRSVFILTTTSGRPWKSGFQASWRKQLARPEMTSLKEKGLVFHGLRKSAVVFLLEAGCTDAEVSAITGQSRQMVEYYSVKVNQRRLARTAILKWEKETRT